MLIDGTTAAAGELVGLSAEAIREVERDQSAPAGAAYRTFLSLIGGGAGRFLRGSDVFHPEIMGLWTSAKELLEDNGSPFVLQETDRVIFMHQGYQFCFLRGHGADPEVWAYCEGQSVDGMPALTHDHFTGWLRDMAEEQMEEWARLVPWYEAEQRKKPGEPRVYMYRTNPDGTVTEEF